MKISIALESLNTVLWCIHYGKKWKVVKAIQVDGILKTETRKQAPHAILTGDGKVEFTNGSAKIFARPTADNKEREG